MRSFRQRGFALAIGLGVSLFAVTGSTAGHFVARSAASLEGAGEYTSLALDPLGRAHVAYFDRARDVLVHAFETPAGWRAEVVDGSGRVGWYASLAVDPRGATRIAYYDVERGVLKLASSSGGAWTSEVVDPTPGAGHYCSLALAPDGTPGISYYDVGHGSLRFARLTRGTWRVETVDGAPGEAGGLGEAAPARGAGNGADAIGSPERAEPFDNVGHYSSLAFDRQGLAHISYQDITHSSLKYAVERAGRWTIATVDAQADVGEHTSLALDPSGRARISYYDAGNEALKLAAERRDGWALETVDAAGNAGAYSSLRLDANGEPHVCYLAAADGTIRYATESAGVWRRETVDAGGASGRGASLSLDRGCSLALDVTGAPVIATGARTGGPFRLVAASAPAGSGPLDGDTAPNPNRALAAWPTPYRGGELNVSFVVPPHSADADVRVVDLAGRHVRTLSDGNLEPGRRILAWDGRDDAGRAVPNGVYFLIGRSDDQTSRLKLAVLR